MNPLTASEDGYRSLISGEQQVESRKDTPKKVSPTPEKFLPKDNTYIIVCLQLPCINAEFKVVEGRWELFVNSVTARPTPPHPRHTQIQIKRKVPMAGSGVHLGGGRGGKPNRSSPIAGRTGTPGSLGSSCTTPHRTGKRQDNRPRTKANEFFLSKAEERPSLIPNKNIAKAAWGERKSRCWELAEPGWGA